MKQKTFNIIIGIAILYILLSINQLRVEMSREIERIGRFHEHVKLKYENR